MNTNKYTKAYVEVLELIHYLPIQEYRKIPKEKIQFYKNHIDKNYSFKINPNINLQEQNFSNEAKAIIINLFMDCFATEDKKQKIQDILTNNQIKKEEEKKKLYDPNSIFGIEKDFSLQTITEDKNIFKVIFNKILDFIRRNK